MAREVETSGGKLQIPDGAQPGWVLTLDDNLNPTLAPPADVPTQLDDLADVDMAGAAEGDVLTVDEEGNVAPAAPSGGSQPGKWIGPFTIYANKWQTIEPTQNAPGYAAPDAGTFKLSYGAQETAALDFDATAAEVLAALNALPLLAGKITLDDTDRTGSGALAGPLPTAGISFMLDDSLAPQLPITLSDNAMTFEAAPIDDWPIGVTFGFIFTDAFTPEVDDIIEDFLRDVVEANAGITATGPQEVFLTDASLDDRINTDPPAFWIAPQNGVVDLNESAQDFANFSGKSASPTPGSALAADAQAAGGAQALPARCLVSVPLRWYIRVQAGAPTPGGVYALSVKLGRVSAP